MNCKNCNMSIPDEATFCPQCGAETSAKAEAVTASKKCPQCGAENPPEAKFCRADGFAFSSAEAEPKKASSVPKEKETSGPPTVKAPIIEEMKPEIKGRRNPLPWVLVICAVCAVIVLAAAFGAYRFFSKATGDLRTQPGTESAVEAPGETPAGNEDKEVDPARLEGQVNRALRKEGLGGVTAVVDDSFIVTLRGVVKNPQDKEKAMKIAQSLKGVRQVKDMIFIIEK